MNIYLKDNWRANSHLYLINSQTIQLVSKAPSIHCLFETVKEESIDRSKLKIPAGSILKRSGSKQKKDLHVRFQIPDVDLSKNVSLQIPKEDLSRKMTKFFKKLFSGLRSLAHVFISYQRV